MKRLGGFELALLVGLGGVVYACAAPEDLDPTVLAEAENRYFSTTAGTPTATPPTTGTTPPVTPTAVTPVTPTATTPPVTPGIPPVTPTAAPIAPGSGGAPQADELEPSDAISLEQWLQQ